jgi:hypothetical protein
MGVDGDAAAVVDDLTTTVGEEADLDVGAVASHGFVHRVVDDLVDHVVEPVGTGRTDVHARALPDGLKAFEHLN